MRRVLAFLAVTAFARAASAEPDFIVSSDRLAQAFIAEHARTKTTIVDVAAVGDALSDRPLERVPRLGLDVAVVKHLTLGASAAATHLSGDAGSATAWAVAPRVGWMARIGRAAIWPRAGVTYASDAGDARTSVTFDLAVAYYFTKTAAVTGTPSVDVALADTGGTRFFLGAGLLAHLDAKADDATPRFARRGTIVISADRLAPIASLGKETRAETSAGQRRTLTVGPGEAYEPSPTTHASLGLDFFLTDHVTFGGTIGLGIVPYEHRVAPDTTTTAHGANFGVAPRAGYAVRVGDVAAMWLRAGASAVFAAARYGPYGTARAMEVDLTLESLLVLFPTSGVGVTIGPNASIAPITSRAGASAPLFGVGTRFAQLGAAAGVLLAF